METIGMLHDDDGDDDDDWKSVEELDAAVLDLLSL